jgi:hypothetical protein
MVLRRSGNVTVPDDHNDTASASSLGRVASADLTFRPLHVLSPIVNWLVVIGLVARPFLEHFGKRSDALPMWVVSVMPLLLICVYVAVGATAYMFYRALHNINVFARKKILVPGPWSAWLMIVPLINVIAIPHLWGRTYYYSLSYLPENRVSRLRALIVCVGSFVLLVSGNAFSLMSDNAALWPPGYDGLSLAMLALCMGSAGAMLFGRIVQRVSAAQELYASQAGLWSRGKKSVYLSGGILGVLRLLAFAVCLAGAAIIAVFPDWASGTVQGLLASAD